MTDRDRLIEILQDTLHEWECDVSIKTLTEITDHLIANGVIVPPCNVGDIVYAKYSGTNEIEYYVIDKVSHLGSNYFEFEAHLENEDGYTVDIIEFTVPEISLTVFLTPEEAEKALERSKGNEMPNT